MSIVPNNNVIANVNTDGITSHTYTAYSIGDAENRIVVVCIGYEDGSLPAGNSTVTYDPGGPAEATFTLAHSRDVSGTQRMEIFYLKEADLDAGAHTKDIKVEFDNSAQAGGIVIDWWSGVDQTNVVGNVADANADAATINVSTANSLVANGGTDGTGGGPLTPDGTQTLLGVVSPTSAEMAFAYEIFGSTGNQTQGWDNLGPSRKTVVLVEFLEATAGGDVTGSGSPQAATATASGNLIQTFLGSGAPQADIATVSGNLIQIHTGSGAPQATTAVASGAGGIIQVVSGSPQAQRATASGAGSLKHVGSGSPQAATATASGEGSVPQSQVTGSGTPQAATATAAGTAVIRNLVQGDPQAERATAAGSAKIFVFGSGGVQAETATASGQESPDEPSLEDSPLPPYIHGW